MSHSFKLNISLKKCKSERFLLIGYGELIYTNKENTLTVFAAIKSNEQYQSLLKFSDLNLQTQNLINHPTIDIFQSYKLNHNSNKLELTGIANQSINILFNVTTPDIINKKYDLINHLNVCEIIIEQEPFWWDEEEI